jgi:hypothetical protein
MTQARRAAHDQCPVIAGNASPAARPVQPPGQRADGYTYVGEDGYTYVVGPPEYIAETAPRPSPEVMERLRALMPPVS